MDVTGWLEANGVVLGLILTAAAAIPAWLMYFRDGRTDPKPGARRRNTAQGQSSRSPAVLALLVAVGVSGLALFVLALVGLPGGNAECRADNGSVVNCNGSDNNTTTIIQNGDK